MFCEKIDFGNASFASKLAGGSNGTCTKSARADAGSTSRNEGEKRLKERPEAPSSSGELHWSRMEKRYGVLGQFGNFGFDLRHLDANNLSNLIRLAVSQQPLVIADIWDRLNLESVLKIWRCVDFCNQEKNRRVVLRESGQKLAHAPTRLARRRSKLDDSEPGVAADALDEFRCCSRKGDDVGGNAAHEWPRAHKKVDLGGHASFCKHLKNMMKLWRSPPANRALPRSAESDFAQRCTKFTFE